LVGSRAAVHIKTIPIICPAVGISPPNLYSTSNGKAETAVKLMKKIIRTAWDGRKLNEEKLYRALLKYRNTPSRKNGLSPTQKLYGHPIQDTLPAHHKSLNQSGNKAR